MKKKSLLDRANGVLWILPIMMILSGLLYFAIASFQIDFSKDYKGKSIDEIVSSASHADLQHLVASNHQIIQKQYNLLFTSLRSSYILAGSYLILFGLTTLGVLLWIRHLNKRKTANSA